MALTKNQPLPGPSCGTRRTRIVPGPARALHTIGYEGIEIERFLQILQVHAVTTVVDVRELPQSRIRGFSKKALTARLARHDVRYVHIRALGCPRSIRYRYRQERDWQRYERDFCRYLARQKEALAALGALAMSANCALLCFEADANHCHRRFVAVAIARMQRLPIVHIGTDQTTAHG